LNSTLIGLLGQPFIQIALPLMVTLTIAAWSNNKRIDELSKRLDDLAGRLGRIEDRLTGIENRLTAVERKVDALEVKAWR
jgi:hypothetical protein